MNRRLIVPLVILGAAGAQEPTPGAEEAPSAATAPPHAVELRSGTVLVGQLEPSAWRIRTAFGELTVPVAEIRRVRFGRRAQPERLARTEQAVAELASGNAERRDRARAALAAEGAFAVPSLARAAKEHEDPEVRRLAAEVLKGLDKAEDDVPADDDRIDTARFTLTGEVELSAFKVHVAELGSLAVRRSDVAQLRSFAPGLVHKLSIGGAQVWPNGWVDSKVRVEKGEPLRVTAQGTVFYPNWGQAFTPDGNPQMGMMNGFMVGTLVARVGEKGTIFRVGSSFTGAAPASGTLQFILNINAGDQPHDGEFAVVVARGPE